MHVICADDTYIIRFTYDEELSLAKSVMDCISLLWVKDDFQRLLDKIYTNKCSYGGGSTAEDILQFIDYLELYDLQHLIPELIDNETSIWHELTDLGINNDEMQKMQAESIRMAWKEVWDQHSGIKSTADAYRSFPDAHIKEAPHLPLSIDEIALERRFWDEVDKIMEEFDNRCSRSEAMIMAADTCPRGIDLN